jgi:hypothetical protein
MLSTLLALNGATRYPSRLPEDGGNQGQKSADPQRGTDAPPNWSSRLARRLPYRAQLYEVALATESPAAQGSKIVTDPPLPSESYFAVSPRNRAEGQYHQRVQWRRYLRQSARSPTPSNRLQSRRNRRHMRS